MAAIASYHAPVGGQSVGKDPLITCFLHGVMRLRPRVWSRVPPWDLAVVLEALCKPPFEPIEEVSERLLTLKMVLLLAISYLKRVGDLQALSVAPSFLDFAPGLAKAFLYPRAGYVPKVPSSVPRSVVLQAFCPPPFREPDQEKLNCMCPVRAYVHRTALWSIALLSCLLDIVWIIARVLRLPLLSSPLDIVCRLLTHACSRIILVSCFQHVCLLMFDPACV